MQVTFLKPHIRQILLVLCSIVRLTSLDNAKSSRCEGEPLRYIVRSLTMV